MRKDPICKVCVQCGAPFFTVEPRTLTCGKSCRSARIAAGGAKRRGENCGAYTHGATVSGARPPEHNSWRAMNERCYNPKAIKYAYYGGRGIRVADEWRGEDGFRRFMEHIGPKPEPKRLYTLDRYPDTNGNYEPGNVRWATWSQQQRNRRPAKPFTHCRRGHLRTPENRIPNGNPTGACGQCRQITDAARAERKRGR
jgi:hypothetical protein